MAKMTDADVLERVKARVADASGSHADKLAKHREKAAGYYRGDPFGNEVEGRSSVVSRDVAQYIDTMMPSLMRIFAGSDQLAKFEPVGREDEQAAQQATDYCNHVWAKDNDGFTNAYTVCKAGLLDKMAVLKIWWDATPEKTSKRLYGLTEEAFTALYHDPDAEIGEVSARVVNDVGPDGVPTPATVYDVEVTRVGRLGRVRIDPMPPEEFRFGSRAKSDKDADILAHMRDVEKSELIGMGYDRKTVEGLGGGEEDDLSDERVTRFEDVDSTQSDHTNEDGANRKVQYVEAYTRLDRDDDGEAEYLKVCYSGSTLLDIEEVDDHPFALFTPIPMPHRMVGMSVAEQLFDVQEIKSVVTRQILDNLYLTNMPRMGVVDGQVNLDDLLTARPGQVVRTRGPNALFPIATQPLGQEPYQMLEHLDGVAEQRTGATRYNQGLDADTLNKTASGINLIQNAAAQRMELIARVYAETGFKRAFKRILSLVTKYDNKVRTLRLRGEWHDFRPGDWNAAMDVSVEVGLGNGNKDQVLAHMMTLLNMDMQIVQMQGGVQGPLITAPNVYAKLRKVAEAMGLKGVEAYYTDPAQMPAPQQQEDPKLVEARAKMELQQQEAQSRMQLEMVDAQNRQTLEQQAAEREAQLMVWRAQQEMQLERWKVEQQAELERYKAQLQAQIAQERAQADAQIKARAVEMQAEARPGE